MKRKTDTDLFFHRQPPQTFVEILKSPVHEKRPPHFGTGVAREGELAVKGIYLDNQFPDHGLLETIIDDFNRFLSVCDIGGKQYQFVLDKLREAGAIAVSVTTGLDDAHAPARRAYEKAGFEKNTQSITYRMKL